MRYEDDDELIHMLGYCSAKQFADAIVNCEYDQKKIMKLAEAVGERYQFDLVGEVKQAIQQLRGD